MLSSEYKYSVYKHTSPSGKVYIGITSVKVEDRWKNGKHYKPCVLFQKAIDKYGWDNLKHEVLYTNINEISAKLIEEDLVYYYMSNNISYNIKPGGDTPVHIEWTEERRQEMSAKLSGINNPFYGKRHSEETKQKFSKIRKGRIPWNKNKRMSKEYCEKNSKAHLGLSVGNKNGMFGKHRTNEEIQKLKEIHSKPVLQYTLDGIYIKTHASIKEATISVNGKSQSHISECARNKCKSAYGYIWKFV